MSGQNDKPSRPDAFPVSPPSRKAERPERRKGEPDFSIEEIEEKHIPKDRNIFDK